MKLSQICTTEKNREIFLESMVDTITCCIELESAISNYVVLLTDPKRDNQLRLI